MPDQQHGVRDEGASRRPEKTPWLAQVGLRGLQWLRSALPSGFGFESTRYLAILTYLTARPHAQ